jgi:hypothetical protein
MWCMVFHQSNWLQTVRPKFIGRKHGLELRISCVKSFIVHVYIWTQTASDMQITVFCNETGWVIS